MTERGDSEYVHRLGAILARRDPAALRTFLEENAARFGDERQVAEVRAKSAAEMQELMHRMIVARKDLAHLHPESSRWLDVRQSQTTHKSQRRRPDR